MQWYNLLCDQTHLAQVYTNPRPHLPCHQSHPHCSCHHLNCQFHHLPNLLLHDLLEQTQDDLNCHCRCHHLEPALLCLIPHLGPNLKIFHLHFQVHIEK